MAGEVGRESNRSKPFKILNKELGDFLLLDRIGEGGMGTVFRAMQKSLNRPVAVKVLSPRIAKNAEFIVRFRREAQAAAALSHPNIVHAITVGEDQGFHYFVMELLEGETVRQRLLRSGRLPLRDVLEIGRQTALALAHAHRKGILHRDIKPENLMLLQAPEGLSIKVMDLGLARLAREDGSVTQSGMALGTPWYNSPEQARGLQELTPACDLYSLGATLFHLATGKPPFEGATAAEIMARHVTEPPPDPKKLNPSLPDEFCALLLQLLAKKPESRYESAALLAEDLQALIDAESSLAGEAAAGGRQAGARARAVVRRRGAARRARGVGTGPLVLAGAALALLVLIVPLLSHPSSTPESRSTKAPEPAVPKTAAQPTHVSTDPEQERLDAMLAAALQLEKNQPDDLEAQRRAWTELRRAGMGRRQRSQAEAKLAALEARLAAAGTQAAGDVTPKAKDQAAVENPKTKVQNPIEAPSDVEANSKDQAAIQNPKSKIQNPIEAAAPQVAQPVLALIKRLRQAAGPRQFDVAREEIKKALNDPLYAPSAQALRILDAALRSTFELYPLIEKRLAQKGKQGLTIPGSPAIYFKIENGLLYYKPRLDFPGGSDRPADALKPAELVGLSGIGEAEALSTIPAGKLGTFGALLVLTGQNKAAQRLFERGITEGELALAEWTSVVAALDAEETESLAAKAWAEAEALFAKKQYEAAQLAYLAFKADCKGSNTLRDKDAALAERLAALETLAKPQPKAETETPPAPAAKTVFPTEAAWAKALNLMPLAIPQDAIAGYWRLQSGRLLSDGHKGARLEFPYQPPEEYDARLTISRLRGENEIALVLSKAGGSFAYVMAQKDGKVFGVQCLDGKTYGQTDVTRLPWSKPAEKHTCIVQVRNDCLKVFLDNEQVVDYKTDFKDVPEGNVAWWKLNHSTVLGIASSASPTFFTSLEVLEITGKGKVIR